MGNLSAIRRGKELCYSFLEARSNCSIPSRTVILVVQYVFRVLTSDCTVEERLSLQERILSNFYPFKLVSEQDLFYAFQDCYYILAGNKAQRLFLIIQINFLSKTFQCRYFSDHITAIVFPKRPCRFYTNDLNFTVKWVHCKATP